MNPLGLTLQDLLGGGRDPVLGTSPGSFAPAAPQAPATPQSHGFFKEGGAGRYIAGALGDALLQQAHMQPIFAPAQRDAQQEAQWTRRQDSQLAQQMALKQWELANRQPTPFEDNAGNRWVTDPATGENKMVFVDRAPKQFIQDGQMVTVQNPYMGNASAPQITEDLWNKGTPVGGVSTPVAPPFGVSGSQLDAITMNAESGGKPNAVSPKGARGLMQVMPSTARDPGFGIRPSNGTPADDVRVGKEYRRAMQTRYGGDPAKMWAAYNAGPGATDRALKQGPSWLSALPPETRNYVRNNLAKLRGR